MSQIGIFLADVGRFFLHFGSPKNVGFGDFRVMDLNKVWSFVTCEPGLLEPDLPEPGLFVRSVT